MTKPKPPSNGTSPAGGLLLAPFSQEAEEAVIGAVMISPHTFNLLQGILQAEYFYLTRHRHMWMAFQRLSIRNEIMDLTTISEEIRQMGLLEEIGGYAYLIHLINNTPNSMHAEAYAHLVERTATRRRLLMAADTIRDAAMDESKSIEQVMGTAEGALADVHQHHAIDEDDIEVNEAIDLFVAEVKQANELTKANPQYNIGIRTGLDDLDMMIDGLRPGDVTTLAGATSMGKTAWVLTVALNASQKGIVRESPKARPAHVLVFSGEMTQKQIMARIMSSKTGFPVRNIERGNLTKNELITLGNATQDFKHNHRLSFVRGKRITTAQIRRRVRKLVAEGYLDLLILDGLLQIEYAAPVNLDDDPRYSRRQDNRRDNIEGIMGELEDIAATYQIAILLTHQLSRAPASRQNKRPQLSDLAEASFVEQKSAVTIFIYRDAYYNPESGDPNAGEVIVAKNRHGETGTIHAYYNRQFTRWENGDVERYSLGD